MPDPIRGIWSVDEFVADGAPQAPLLANTDRWQRVIFDSPDAFYFQDMNSQIGYFAMALDTTSKTFTLAIPTDQRWKARFTYENSEPNRMILDGNLAGRHLNMTLHRTDLTQFLLLNRGFHMINQTMLER